MLQGTGSLSLSRQDLPNQQNPAIGFQKLQFAHKAAAGDTGINLASLTLPPEMSSNGFSNPPGLTLTSTHLLFNRKNLRLWSSLRGEMTDYYQYYVASSSQITFLNFTAEEGEIFRGTIDYNISNGNNFIATITPPATGTLAVGTTDFNCGFSFKVGLYPASQSGAVYVYRGTQLMARNVGNATASVSADGDYQEVDNGTGSGTIIRFNRPDPDNAIFIQVLPSGRMAELPSPSMTSQIESIQGQVNSMASYVSAAIGQTVTTILASAPTQLDLKAFGDRVIALEQNRARIDLSNTWTAYQQLPGRTDGSVVPTGYLGEQIPAPSVNGAWGISSGLASASIQTIATLTLTAGVWLILASAYLGLATGTFNQMNFAVVNRTANLTDVGGIASSLFQNGNFTAAANFQFWVPFVSRTVTISATTTYFMNAQVVTNSGTWGWDKGGTNGGEGALYAVRIG